MRTYNRAGERMQSVHGEIRVRGEDALLARVEA